MLAAVIVQFMAGAPTILVFLGIRPNPKIAQKIGMSARGTDLDDAHARCAEHSRTSGAIVHA
jgi:hypothetical protein